MRIARSRSRPAFACEERNLWPSGSHAGPTQRCPNGHTSCAERCCSRASSIHLGIPWLAETPAVRDGQTSVFKLPEWLSVMKSPHSVRCDLDQCVVGSGTTKPTTLVSGQVSISDLALTCTHPRREWTVPWSGEKYSSPHPRLRRAQWAIPASE